MHHRIRRGRFRNGVELAEGSRPRDRWVAVDFEIFSSMSICQIKVRATVILVGLMLLVVAPVI